MSLVSWALSERAVVGIQITRVERDKAKAIWSLLCEHYPFHHALCDCDCDCDGMNWKGSL
jgi:hypothetical protein